MVRWLRRALRRQGDDGVGLILVIGVSTFVFLLAAATVGLAINGLTQSRNRTNFEKSLADAETGIDSVLGKVQVAFTEHGDDYPIPANTPLFDGDPGCFGAPVDDPGSFATEADERAWARAQLETLTSDAACVHDVDGGQYVVLKPKSAQLKYGKIYALAAMPSFADPQRTRLVKDEYIFMPYRPTAAILAGANVDISASTTVTTAAGTPPHTAGVHANGNITGNGAAPQIDGPVTFSGTSSRDFSGQTPTHTAAEAIPYVSAGSLYRQAWSTDPAALADWYDLCNDGTVRSYAGAGHNPCTGALAGTTLGWSYTAGTHTWTASASVPDGTYYADKANIKSGNGNKQLGRITLIASSAGDGCGTDKYGNIDWNLYDLTQTAFGGLWMVADSDLLTGKNFSAGSEAAPVSSGVFVAGDQMQMETSSQGAVGSVIIGAQNEISGGCEPPDGLVPRGASQVKNPTIYYDANADGAFTSVVTTSLWLDYSSGN